MAVQEQVLVNAATQVGLVETQQLAELRNQARRNNLSLPEIICRAGRFPSTALYRALAQTRKIPYFERSEIQIHNEWLDAFNGGMLLRRLFLPVAINGELTVLSGDPDDRVAVETVQRTLGKPAALALANPLMIEAVLREHFRIFETGLSAIKIFDDIMKEAYLRQATDLHFESAEDGMQLRMRVDGKMQYYDRPINRELAEALMSRIKVLSGMDIAEQHMAQDGGFGYRIRDWEDVNEVEMRVATIPTRFGERATLRILGQGTADLKLAQLGVPEHLLGPFQETIRKPHGIVLVTGPTGSGKSTTLYASLRELNSGSLNILTVEDPIEQVVEGISQVQVSEKVSFAKALRSFLRHDPDVMLVGEIRDQETAETAVRAAMTGHLVLSTLHTNSSVAAINRLVDIGCQPFLIASTLLGAVAQRLLRRICSHCKTEYQADRHELRLLGRNEPTSLYKGEGCAHCLGTGFSGRIGIYETFWINETIEQMIHQRASDEELFHAAKDAGMLNTLWEDARQKVLDGITTIQEASLLYSAHEIPQEEHH